MKINDYEQLVLSACLIDPKAVLALAPHLAPDRFARPEHRTIYDAILDLHKTKKVPDVGSVSFMLGSNLESIGGSQYLSLLANKPHSVGIKSTAGLKTWAEVVDKSGRLRHVTLITSSYVDKLRALDENLDAATDVDSVIAELMRDIRFSQTGVRGGYVGIADASVEYEQRLNQAMLGKPTDVMATGFKSIDSMMAGGFPRGGLFVLCGLSSDGKTSLAIQIAHNVAAMMKARNVPGKVLINSFEMKAWKLVQRLASGYAQVDSKLVTAGLLKQGSPEAERLFRESARIRELPIKIDDSSFESSLNIQFHAAMETSEAPVKLIIIDFAEMVRDEAKTEEQRVSSIFNNAKQLAKDTDATVIMLAQYNRTVDARPDRMGSMSDIRYSGAAEHVADAVGHIYNPIQQEIRGHQIVPPNTMPLVWVEKGISGHAYFFVDKNRDGPTGVAKLLWTPAFTSFADLKSTGDLDEEF